MEIPHAGGSVHRPWLMIRGAPEAWAPKLWSTKTFHLLLTPALAAGLTVSAFSQAPVQPAGNTTSTAGVSGAPGSTTPGDSPTNSGVDSKAKAPTPPNAPAASGAPGGVSGAVGTAIPVGTGTSGNGTTPATSAGTTVPPGTTGFGAGGAGTGDSDASHGVTRSSGAGIIDGTTRQPTGTPSYGAGVGAGTSSGTSNSAPVPIVPSGTGSNNISK